MALIEHGSSSLLGPASTLKIECTSRSSRPSCEDKTDALNSPQKGQSSEKSSQDRLSLCDLHDKEETECWPGESPISSKLYIPASLSATPTRVAKRVSPRRVKVEEGCNKEKPLAGGSPRHRSCADPEWTPTPLSAREDASSGTPPARSPASPLHSSDDRCTSELALDAKQRAEDAVKEALLKKETASKLVAAAKRLAVEAARGTKRRRVVQKPAERLNSPDHILLGARVAVYWPDDKQFYNGRVVDVKDEGFLHKVEYDDEVTEWLPLSSERFILLTPRTTSAGCTTQFLEEVEALEAEGFSACKQGSAKSDLGPRTPRGEAALGWLVAVQCRSNGRACQGQLIAYAEDGDRHHLLYADGEDEWLCLAKEGVQWIQHMDHPIAPGLPEGLSKPVGEQAVGWRVAVYWRADKAFYHATIKSYDPATGQYCLAYAKGEREHLHLGSQCLKWCPAPEASKYFHAAAGRGTLASLGGSAHSVAGESGWGSAFKVSRPRSSRLGRRQNSGNGSSSAPDLTAQKCVNESVDAMLERVDADEAALMSRQPHPFPYFHLETQPQLRTYSSAPHQLQNPEPGLKPYQLEGADSSSVRIFQPITPAQTAELNRRTFPSMGALPTQVLRVASPAPLWTLDTTHFNAFDCTLSPAPVLRGLHFAKSESDLLRHHRATCTPPPEDRPLPLSSGLLADLERATSMPTAPSPAPLLDYLSGQGMMFPEPGLASDDCQPCPIPEMGGGNISLDLVTDDFMHDFMLPQDDPVGHEQDWMTDL